jgi:hypothetical protein
MKTISEISRQFSEQDIIEMVLCFPNWRQFRRVGPLKPLSRHIARSGLIDRYFPGERRSKSGYDTEGLRRLADRYEKIIDLVRDFPSVYAYIASNHLQESVFSEKHLSRGPSEDEIMQLEKTVREYSAMSVFAKAHPNLMAYIRRHDLVDRFFPPETRNRRARSESMYSVERLRDIVSRYDSLAGFQNDHRRAYEYIKYHQLQAEVYPADFASDRLHEREILKCLMRLEDIRSIDDMQERMPKFAAYLVHKNVNPKSFLKQPFPVALELINSLRRRNKIEVDPKELSEIKAELTTDEEPSHGEKAG